LFSTLACFHFAFFLFFFQEYCMENNNKDALYTKGNSAASSREEQRRQFDRAVEERRARRTKRSSSQSSGTTSSSSGSSSSNNGINAQALLNKVAALTNTQDRTYAKSSHCTPNESPNSASPRSAFIPPLTRPIYFGNDRHTPPQSPPQSPRRRMDSNTTPTSPRQVAQQQAQSRPASSSTPHSPRAKEASLLLLQQQIAELRPRTDSSPTSYSMQNQLAFLSSSPSHSPRRREELLLTASTPTRKVSSPTADARRNAFASSPKSSLITSTDSLHMPHINKDALTLQHGLTYLKKEALEEQKEKQPTSPQRKYSRPTPVPTLTIPTTEPLDAPSKLLLKTTSSRHLLQLYDQNRHPDDTDSESESDYYSSDETEQEENPLDASIRLGQEELELLYSNLDLLNEESKEEIKAEFKKVAPTTRERKQSNIILSPRNRILQAGVSSFKRYANGVVNFCRTDIQVDNWKFCFVCDSSQPNTRYVRQLTPTDVRPKYAGFEQCIIYRIIKFCPTCFKFYEDQQNKSLKRVIVIPITARARNLFCEL
jgi:hypothetical protein